MSNEYITLWTLHTPDFSIIEGRIDHSKSKYYQDTPGVKQAYSKLWQYIKIPDGQIIWCYLDKTEIRKTSTKMVLWEICLPKSKIIKYVDDMVWNRILGIKCHVPSSLSDQWRQKAIKKFPHNPTLAHEYEKKCRDDYWAQKPKGNSWWDELFVKMDKGLSMSALIRHPVQEDLINNKIIWCS